MRKATQSDKVPMKILKQSAYIFLDYIYNLFHCCINKVKYANIHNLLLQKSYRGLKEGYLALGILLVIIKTLEIFLSKQRTLFMDEFLSKCQGVFERVTLHSTACWQGEKN